MGTNIWTTISCATEPEDPQPVPAWAMDIEAPPITHFQTIHPRPMLSFMGDFPCMFTEYNVSRRTIAEGEGDFPRMFTGVPRSTLPGVYDFPLMFRRNNISVSRRTIAEDEEESPRMFTKNHFRGSRRIVAEDDLPPDTKSMDETPMWEPMWEPVDEPPRYQPLYLPLSPLLQDLVSRFYTGALWLGSVASGAAIQYPCSSVTNSRSKSIQSCSPITEFTHQQILIRSLKRHLEDHIKLFTCKICETQASARQIEKTTKLLLLSYLAFGVTAPILYHRHRKDEAQDIFVLGGIILAIWEEYTNTGEGRLMVLLRSGVLYAILAMLLSAVCHALMRRVHNRKRIF